MFWLILFLTLLLLLSLPGLWVQYVLRKHHAHRPDFPGTGEEMARHLLTKLEIEDVGVEATPDGDHYDPQHKMVRLTQDKLEGKTLTSVVVAAHEVGHALQHHRKETLFQSRTLLAYLAYWAQKTAPLALMVAPMLLSVAPAASRWALFAAVAAMLLGTLMHLLTLPVEWDASFNKALPLLEEGGYFAEQDRVAARQILKAAALTYVAGSLASLLNVWRWLRYLRR
ncbi:zinc metallopeptidase [Bacterioplanoides sp.]|uniref:zinc metallopeptidase n=1 Tax=Bacterioplanoides sp. TaxID=2066072 RepID=UPI003B00487F